MFSSRDICLLMIDRQMQSSRPDFAMTFAVTRRFRLQARPSGGLISEAWACALGLGRASSHIAQAPSRPAGACRSPPPRLLQPLPSLGAFVLGGESSSPPSCSLLEKSLCLRTHVQTCGVRPFHELQKQSQARVDVANPESAQQACDEPRATCASPLVQEAGEGNGRGILETR